MIVKKFENSLLEFNERVLYNGHLFADTSSMEVLKNKLFFNQIFVSNTDEMFEKYNMNKLVRNYLKDMSQVNRNILTILRNVMRAADIEFTREDSFERRFAIYEELQNIVITDFYQSINSIHYQFKPSQLYYISYNIDGRIAISYVDMKHEIYHKAFHRGKTYWKVEECIASHINETLHAEFTIVVKITTSRDNGNVITKVEYNGDRDNIQKIISMFGRKCLVFRNPFIYTKDIEYTIKDLMPKKEEVQKLEHIDILDLLKQDRIIEYPRESFITYLGFLRSIVNHPETRLICITLYRVGKDPTLFYILRDAVEKGIKVHVNMELCASGEDINTFWAHEMILAGIHVTTYESGSLKVHSKLTLAKMNNGIALAQIGTGNYNSSTISQYTDLSLVTSNVDICNSIEKVFSIFNGKPHQEFNENLLVTRYNMRETLYELIEQESEKGDNGYICIKCNSLSDLDMIRALDKAALAGCKIDLIIRGVCTWIPRYDNVIVKSIIWDKLEHSRVYCFGKENPIMYLGSLDLVTSKLEERIETMVRITDIDAMVQLVDYINNYITCANGSWIMDDNGIYNRIS